MDFKALLGGVTEEIFFNTYWEKEPLVIERHQPTFYQNLLTWEDLNGLLSTSRFRADECKVSKSGQIVNSGEYISKFVPRVMEKEVSDYVDTIRLLSLYARGATLVFSQINHRWQPVEHLKQLLEKTFNAALITNLFATKEDAQGFSVHYDSHCVILLQLYGSKKWKLYKAPVDLPLKSQSFGRLKTRPGEKLADVTLRAGDLLYIPRGVMHEAKTSDQSSLHLTLGIHPVKKIDLLNDLISVISLRDSGFRESLPLNFSSLEGSEKETMVRQLLADVLDQTTGSLVDQIHAAELNRFEGSASFAQLNHLEQIEMSRSLSMESVIKWYTRIPSIQSSKPGILTLVSNNKFLEFPSLFRPLLEFVQDLEIFQIGNLPSEFSKEDRLYFTTRLIEEGFCEIESLSALKTNHRLQTALG